jgi:ankyrin repeat protein
MDIVKLLFQDPRVNPADQEDEAITVACEEGHTEIFRLLLQDPRVTPTATLFRRACEMGRHEIVELLLQDPRVDPADWDNDPFIQACSEGRTEVVKLLLLDPRVNPADLRNRGFQRAAADGHLEVVKLLLLDPRVDPTDKENSAFFWACDGGRRDLIDYLVARRQTRIPLLSIPTPSASVQFEIGLRHLRIYKERVKEMALHFKRGVRILTPDLKVLIFSFLYDIEEKDLHRLFFI